MTDEESYDTRHGELLDELHGIGGFDLSNRVDTFIGETMSMYQDRGIEMGKEAYWTPERRVMGADIAEIRATVSGLKARIDRMAQEMGVSK